MSYPTYIHRENKEVNKSDIMSQIISLLHKSNLTIYESKELLDIVSQKLIEQKVAPPEPPEPQSDDVTITIYKHEKTTENLTQDLVSTSIIL